MRTKSMCLSGGPTAAPLSTRAEWLELVEAAPPVVHKFKVGDKIRGIGGGYYSITHVGWVGYVIELMMDGQIKVCSNKKGRGSRWAVEEQYFELIERHEPVRDEEGHIICAECGCIIEDESEATEIDGKWYCEDCVESEFTVCEVCGEYHPNDDMHYICEMDVCDDCLRNSGRFRRCEACDEWIDIERDDYGSFFGGGTICEGCMESDDYEQCEDCGMWFDYDCISWDEDDECYRCADCDRRHARKAIHNYGYKPDPIFKTGTHDHFYTDASIKELLFGVELEIDKGDDPSRCAQEIIDNTEDIYCKHDGSLSDGVEIVSHPCTLEYHRNSLGWDKICDIARKHRFLSQDAKTCGLHIHVGRNQMGDNYRTQDETAGKIVLLVDRHWDTLVKFTRRPAAKLDQWAARPRVKYDYCKRYGRSLTTVAQNTVDNGRYQAVNLENDATVEFRLFAGTLKVSTIYATLQLVSNIVTYAKDHTPDECMASKWTEITGVANYPELTEYLKNRDIVDGCDPTEYDWKPEEREVHVDEAVIREDGKFKVGDRVRIVNDEGNNVPDLGGLIDEEATVAVVYEENEALYFEYGIVFDEEAEGLHGLYSHGRCVLDEERGYSVYGYNLELVSPAA